MLRDWFLEKYILSCTFREVSPVAWISAIFYMFRPPTPYCLHCFKMQSWFCNPSLLSKCHCEVYNDVWIIRINAARLTGQTTNQRHSSSTTSKTGLFYRVSSPSDMVRESSNSELLPEQLLLFFLFTHRQWQWKRGEHTQLQTLKPTRLLERCPTPKQSSHKILWRRPGCHGWKADWADEEDVSSHTEIVLFAVVLTYFSLTCW